MTAAKKPTLDNLLHRFVDYRQKMQDAYESMAKVYVQALDNYENAQDVFADSFPAIDKTTWRRLEALGRNKLDKRLLNNRTAAATRLERLPRIEQTKILNEGVELYIPGRRQPQVLQIEHLDREHIRQVFRWAAIRNIEQQKAWHEAEMDRLERKRVQDAREPDWYIFRGHVHAVRNCVIPTSDLKRALNAYDPKVHKGKFTLADVDGVK